VHVSWLTANRWLEDYSKTMLQLNRPWQATATTAPNVGKAACVGFIRAMFS